MPGNTNGFVMDYFTVNFCLFVSKLTGNTNNVTDNYACIFICNLHVFISLLICQSTFQL